MIVVTNPPDNVSQVANLLWQIGIPNVSITIMEKWSPGELWFAWEYAVRQCMADSYGVTIAQLTIPKQIEDMMQAGKKGGAA